MKRKMDRSLIYKGLKRECDGFTQVFGSDCEISAAMEWNVRTLLILGE